MTQASVPTTRPLPLPTPTQAQGIMTQNVLTLAATVMLPGLLFFGAKAVMNPVLWGASPWLLIPELVLIAVTMIAAVMGLLSAPQMIRELRAGQVSGQTRVQQQNWVMLAFFAASTQIAWAVMVSSFLNCA